MFNILLGKLPSKVDNVVHEHLKVCDEALCELQVNGVKVIRTLLAEPIDKHQ